MQAAARTSLEQESQLEEAKATIRKQDDTIRDLKESTAAKTKQLDKLRQEIIDVKANNTILKQDLEKMKKDLQSRKEESRALERQLEAAADPEQNRSQWSKVPLPPVKVKGEDDPLSNFFECKIASYGTYFTSVEHALQYRKLCDHGRHKDAEALRHIPSPSDVKERAASLLGRSKNLKWEDECDRVMRLLLEVKKNSSPEFVEALKDTGNRKIIHNVASTVWGTGQRGNGKNRFGRILMDLRDKWFNLQSTAKMGAENDRTDMAAGAMTDATGMAAAAQIDSTDTDMKPQLHILGNSLTKGIRAEKLSRDFDTTIPRADTITAAQQRLANLTGNPSVIAFQLITNDVKESQSPRVTEALKSLIDDTKTKFPNTKIMISLAPHPDDASRQATRTALVNAGIQDAYQGTDVLCISNRGITSFTGDGIHLTQRGTSQLASNIKLATNTALDISPTSSKHAGQSRYRNAGSYTHNRPNQGMRRPHNLQWRQQEHRWRPRNQAGYYGRYKSWEY